MSNSESSASHLINAQEDGKTEASSSSLLSLLDDKNKTIATLQKRLENQKEQLSYYLKRELSVPKIVRLSESCSPRAPLQSVAVSMAMSRFGKPLGVRSELCALYERARAADGGVDACLRDQEFVLRKVVTKLCEFVKYANGGHAFGLQFSNFIVEPRHLELFGGLLRATARLRRKLDTFRICCDRLLVAEDERNAIAEQIYSVPAEQRIDNNYLIGVQMEKMQLENEIKQILRDQGEDRERIKEITVIEEKLSNLQRQLNSAFARNDETRRINKMLQKVNFEARILLELTKEQRRRYQRDAAKARSEKNLSLDRMLLFVRLATQNKPLDEVRKELAENGGGSDDDMIVFECVKKEIDGGKNKIVGRMFDELQSKRKECEASAGKLNQIMLEKNELKMAKVQLQRDISDMRLNQCKELAALKQERDAYKSQVEDLEAIREAYAQLVDRQPTATRLEREYVEQIGDMDKHINELEKLNTNLGQKVNFMKVVINKQHREIKLQNDIIEDLSEQVEANYLSRNDKTPKHVNKKPSTDDSGIYTPREGLFSEEFDDVSFGEVYEEAVLVEKQINWLEDQQYRSPPRTKRVQFDTKCQSDSDDGTSRKETDKIVESIKNHILEKAHEAERDKALKWNEDDIRRLFESADADLGVISKSVEPARCPDLKPGDAKEEDIGEHELMRDCSQESIPVCVCRKRSTRVSTEDSVSRKPKKIEILAKFEDKMSSASSDDYTKHASANMQSMRVNF